MAVHCQMELFKIWKSVPCRFGPWEVTAAVRFEPEPVTEADTQG